MQRRLKLSFILLIFSQSLLAATIHARLDRKHIAAGETFQLIITISGQTSHVPAPNLLNLQKNFSILGTARSNQFSIVNGKTRIQKKWIITLLPKHSGNLNIPALKFGSLTTQVIPVHVTSSFTNQTHTAPTSQKLNNVFMQASVSPKNPYVQGEAIYTLKLFYNASIVNATLTAPTAKNIEIQKLGQDKRYQVWQSGRRYEVLQRRYLITPQRAGTVTILSPVLSGQMATRQRTTLNSPFGSPYYRLAARPIQITAPKVILKVKAKPARFTGHWWLPAKRLSLTEMWSDNLQKLKVGQPITRTITLTAAGLKGTQLPQIKPQPLANINIYPGSPSLDSTLAKDTIIGKRVEKFVYIPTKGGTYTLPALKLAWWNTQTQRQQITSLPAQTLQVAAGSATVPTKRTTTPLTTTKIAKPMAAKSKLAKLTQLDPLHPYDIWILTGIAILGLGMGGLAAFWLRRKRKQHPAQQRPATALATLSVAQISQKIEQNCIKNDPYAVKDAILTWTKQSHKHKKIRSLGDLAKNTQSIELKQALIELEQHLYAKHPSGISNPWNGAAFWQIFKINSAHKSTAKKHADETLPGLYLN